ncbi:MAG: hypothetical protein LBT09_07275 [Planctomycetaceae bacterium]|jgi:hypothetical protein|nr:hypothetical protein [Planctomycetaceae bacterium]
MKSIKKYFFVTIIIFAIVIFSNLTNAQNNSDSKKPEPQVQRIAGLNAKFIVALIDDGLGGAWIGTEDEGVFHCDSNNKISQFTTKKGLGDNNGYALAIDKLGRLWVGHLNAGVSVFNGKDWKNYDVVDGPIGERIFDIKTCPKDGDVWIATSAGISRYKIDSDNWEHFTREDGLLEDQVSTLAFKNDGTLIVGTQCHGLAIFNRNIKGEYKHSKNIVAPDRFGQGNISPVPLVPRGIGLPSNLINDILVTKNSEDETIWIATNAGLAKMNNDFKKIEYWRGKDYANKVRGLYGGAPKDWKECSPEVKKNLLPEDYLTCLAEDEQGAIWIGTRQNGFVIADQKAGKQANSTKMNLPDNFVTKILLREGNDYLTGFYGGGIIKPIKPYKLVDRKPLKTKFNKAKLFSVAQNNFPNLPSKIKPPTIDDLKLMQTKLERLRTPLPKVYAAYLGEDWKTQGDWMGRAFRDWAIMCAAVSPLDYQIYFTNVFYDAHEFIGPNRNKNDVIRRWVHWRKTDNPKVLWDPFDGYRRQAEWDDHGEAYSWSKDGPDLWYLLEIRHQGVFKIGMYFYNKDGHNGANRYRDYLINVFVSPNTWTTFDEWEKFSENAEKQTTLFTPLSKTRVNNFWGGVHKYFVITGPTKLYVKIDRNYSFNTILSSVTVDRLYGEPTMDEERGIPFMQMIPYEPLPIDNVYNTEVGSYIASLWNVLDNAYNKFGNIELQRKGRIAAYHAANGNKNLDAEIANLFKSLKWRLNQWDSEQRKEWETTVKKAWKKFYDTNPTLRKSIDAQKDGPPKFIKDIYKK